MDPCCLEVSSFRVSAERLTISRQRPPYVLRATHRRQKFTVSLNASTG
jgi:hypothetical protein